MSIMPSIAALTIHIFGAVALFSGIAGLLNPSFHLQQLDLPAAAAPAIQASSLGAIAIGVFYILAAFQENRAFFKLTLLTRTLTAIWAMRLGGEWTVLGRLEGLGAIITACALVLER
jgi:hypothetical protein